MGVYHGAYKIELTTGAERRYDYYKLMGQYLPLVTRNKDTARLIDVMYRQEYAASVNLPRSAGIFPEQQSGTGLPAGNARPNSMPICTG